MVIRKLQREVAVVAIAACAPLVFGCATTDRFVVDPDPASPAEIDAFEIHGARAAFDASAGAIDSVATTITGIGVDGAPATFPLAQVERLYVRDVTRNHAVDAKPDALVAGASWRPRGQVQYVALDTGEVVDVRKTPTTLDAGSRAVLCAPADGPATAISFDEIQYVQIKDPHSVRTAFCVIGITALVSCVALAIAMSQDDFSLLGDGDW